MVNGFFTDIVIIIVLATAGAFILKLLKQPLIPAYIITGLAIGPYGFGLITNTEIISVFAEIGIAFLLFVVGLELDFSRMKSIGLVSTAGGTLLTLASLFFGILISIGIGFRMIEAVYLGLVVAFSSTLVVIKLLSDYKELDTLHGRIMVGFLLMQDIIAIIALSILSSLGSFTPMNLIFSVLEGLGIIALAIIAGAYVFPALFKQAAKSQEILFLTSISICLSFAMLALLAGFSIAIGGFVAGLSLGSLPYSFQIISRVTPMRDFFATLFFVSLGAQLMLPDAAGLLLPATALLGFVLFLRPLITIVLTNFFGYATKVSFIVAASLTQVSEFSLIIVAQGEALGHIDHNILTATVLLTLVTMTSSSYIIRFDNAIYKMLHKPLRIFSKIGKKRNFGVESCRKCYNTILVGSDRLGYTILKSLQKIKKKTLVIDFNPDIVKKLIKEGIPAMYGDAGDNEIIERVDFKSAEMVITTFPSIDTNIFLLRKVREKNKSAVMILTAGKVEDALKLYDEGADYVILPHFLGGEHVSFLLHDVSVDIKKLLRAKVEHIKELNERKALGHEHPERAHHRG